MTCKLCDPSKLPTKTCKITQTDVLHAPEDEVPVGYTDYQPLKTDKGYCIEGSPHPAKPHKALNCSASGQITELQGIYCHDPSAPAEKHRYVRRRIPFFFFEGGGLGVGWWVGGLFVCFELMC